MTTSWRLDDLPAVAVGPPSAALDDLLLDAPQVVAHLRRSVSTGDWLDAYLFAAGLGQLVDDHLHPDPAALRRAAAFLRSGNSRAGTAASTAASAAATVLGLTARTRARRELRQMRLPLGVLIDALAAVVMDPAKAPDLEWRVRALLDRGTTRIAPLRGEIMRLPAAFRSFDQHPDDLARLADAALDGPLSPTVPMCVVGVRTSGSYLAPLLAAALRNRGVRHVEVLTHRPHRPLLGEEIEQLQRVSGAGGQVVIIDDPPGSGTSLAATASAVNRIGVVDDAIVLAACTFSDAGPWPAQLGRWASVTLPWSQWSVHDRMTAAAVGRALARLVDLRLSVEGVRRTSGSAPARRAHLRAEYRVQLRDDDGASEERDIVVEGAGLGYLGRHAIAVADALYGWTPRVYGLADGLLFSDSPPSEAPVADASTARQIAEYCAQRHDDLPARHDPTGRMRGRDPVWEVAAALLAGMFGRLGPLARPLLLEPLTRSLLRVRRPSVVDGATELNRWRVDPVRGRLVKLTPSDRAFSHLEAACYDPVFDLAGAAADATRPAFEAELRTAYERCAGAAVRPEAWLLYRLVHLWRRGRAAELDPATVARSSALAVTECLADLYLGDLRPAHGPLCAIDLDGVLETDPLGYPVLTPTGALALRALIRHGFRPVLATGRSVADARERCRALGLPGAVAEYGAVVYVTETDEVVDQRSAAQRRLVEELRGALGRHPGVDVDPGHRFAIRARSEGGPLLPTQLALTVRDRSAEVVFVRGEAQTDVTVAGLDKASGLQALAALLGGDTRCALAVGDGAADVSMLAAAERGRAPANAAGEVREAEIPVGRRSYQAGLADAVTDLVGHRPGGCPTCRPPDLPAPTRALVDVLRLRENGMRGLAPRTARLAVAVGRSVVTSRW